MKLSKSDIEEIKQRRENGLPRRKIANEYGISEQLVRSIECSQKYNLDKVKKPKNKQRHTRIILKTKESKYAINHPETQCT